MCSRTAAAAAGVLSTASRTVNCMPGAGRRLLAPSTSRRTSTPLRSATCGRASGAGAGRVCSADMAWPRASLPTYPALPASAPVQPDQLPSPETAPPQNTLPLAAHLPMQANPPSLTRRK